MKRLSSILFLVYFQALLGQKCNIYKDSILDKGPYTSHSRLTICENDSVEFFNVIPGGIWHTDYYCGKISKKKGNLLTISFPPVKFNKSTCIPISNNTGNNDSVTFIIKYSSGALYDGLTVDLFNDNKFNKTIFSSGPKKINAKELKEGQYTIQAFSYLPAKLIHSSKNSCYEVILYEGFVENKARPVTMLLRLSGDTARIEKLNCEHKNVRDVLIRTN